MTRDEIISKVKELGLPDGSYVVFGSGPLAAAGLREAGDIDMVVSTEVLEELRKAGWEERVKAPDDKPLVHEEFEVFDHWNFSPNKPTLAQLLASATVIDGIPFASLEEVRTWKVASGRPQDLIDIKLIDEYLASNQ